MSESVKALITAQGHILKPGDVYASNNPTTAVLTSQILQLLPPFLITSLLPLSSTSPHGDTMQTLAELCQVRCLLTVAQ
jgi:hypothetical protein